MQIIEPVANYVLKSGDTMTGDLNLGTNALLWSGLAIRRYSSSSLEITHDTVTSIRYDLRNRDTIASGLKLRPLLLAGM